MDLPEITLIQTSDRSLLKTEPSKVLHGSHPATLNTEQNIGITKAASGFIHHGKAKVSEDDDPGKTLTIHEADYNQIDVTVFVKLNNVDKYTNKIGLDYKFYCTECNYKCDTLQTLAKHIDSKRCEEYLREQEEDKDIYTVYCNNSQEQGEHNYARFVPDDLDDIDEALLIDEPSKELKQLKADGPTRSLPVKTKMACPETLKLGLPETLSVDITPPTATRNFFQCLVCSYNNLHSEEEYDQHSQCHFLYEGENTLQCYFCIQEGDPSFSDIHDWVFLREHLHQCHDVNFKIPCTYCDVVVNSHVALREHEKAVHILSCPHCLFTCLKPTHMEIHWSCHDSSEEKSFACFICGFRSVGFSDRWSSMQSHIIVKHPGVHEANFTCTKCGKGYQDHYSFTNHVASCHFARPDINCVICQVSQNAAEYAFHIRSCIRQNAGLLMDRMISTGMDGDNLKCSEHSLTFNNEDCMMLHFVHEHLGPVFPNYNGPRKELFQYLKEKASVGCDGLEAAPAVKCAVCHEMVPGKLREFKQHMQNEHSNEESTDVLCPICDRKFVHYSSVHYHIRTVHAGLPKRRKSDRKITQVFRCEKCDYESVSRQRLKNHFLSVHQGIRQYKCSYCSYASNEQTTMKRHILRHKGLQAHKCHVDGCTYRTEKRAYLVKHSKKVHGLVLPTWNRPHMKKKAPDSNQPASDDGQLPELQDSELFQEGVMEEEMEQIVEVVASSDSNSVHRVQLADGQHVEIVGAIKFNEAQLQEVEGIEIDGQTQHVVVDSSQSGSNVKLETIEPIKAPVVARQIQTENGGIVLGNIMDMNGDMTITLQSLF